MVTKDVLDYAIVAGVPAKVIGCTLETDKKFFCNPIVLENYYDKSVLQEY